MLIGNTKSVPLRLLTVLLALPGITVGGVLLAAVASRLGCWDWPVRSSSPGGVCCGCVAGAIVLFEMAILPRRWLRRRRLGAAKLWMQLHIWLGLVSVPVVLVHSGFRLGGPLPAATLVLFLLVVLSGVWGLALQQWLPQKMLADVPGETVASQVDFTGDHHAQEAARLIASLVEVSGVGDAAPTPQARGGYGGASVAVAQLRPPLLTGAAAADLRQFSQRELLPYLRGGRRSGSALQARAEVERRFARLRELTPPDAGPVLERLEALCDLRRQWDVLGRLQFWLHNWVLVHLPLSACMTGLMLLHAVRALKYW